MPHGAPSLCTKVSLSLRLTRTLTKTALDAGHSEVRMPRAKRFPDIWVALRPARLSDGDALQSYIRGLSPQSRYNRFLARQ